MQSSIDQLAHRDLLFLVSDQLVTRAGRTPCLVDILDPSMILDPSLSKYTISKTRLLQ